LFGLNHTAADGAGSGEDFLQGVTVTSPNGSLQGSQISAKSPENIKHRVAVVEKHVAPHHWVRGSDSGEVSETAGGKFYNLLLQVSF
jgi:hypothetical protein